EAQRQDVFEEQAVEGEPAQQGQPEQREQGGLLDLDEKVVAQIDREPAEDHHQHRGQDRHRRQPALQPVADTQRDQRRGHEDAGCDIDAAEHVAQEEREQRPEVEGETAQLLVHRRHAAPVNALAKPSAEKLCRSSSPSPTPMKWMGRPNLAASATRMPPFAVPSSLVMMRPVSGTMLLKASTCAIAFWPVVASSTSSTACGALASSLRMTRTIFSSSAIRPALFCNLPAVSTSSTSALAARAFASAS